MVKGWVKRMVARAVRHEPTWRLLDHSLLRLTRYIEWEREKTGDLVTSDADGLSREQQRRLGKEPYRDMELFLTHVREPLVFDVGANTGQTIERVYHHFPQARIHSFEPSPATFQVLQRNASARPWVTCHNCALGAEKGEASLNENEFSASSSLLPLGAEGRGHIERQTKVPVTTVDQVCADYGIERIDVLKSDTQGFELQVFRGAEKMLREGRIGLVYYEVWFSETYRELPPFHQVVGYLLDHGFRMVSMYDCAYERYLSSWGDALLVHKSFYDQAMAANAKGH